MLLTTFFVIVTTVCDLSLPYYFGLGVDIVSKDTRRGFLGNMAATALNWLALTFSVTIAFRFFTANREMYLTSRIGQNVVFDLRSSMFRHIQRVGIRYIDKRGVGSVMSRLQNDVAVIDQLFTDGIVDILSQMVILVGIVVP